MLLHISRTVCLLQKDRGYTPLGSIVQQRGKSSQDICLQRQYLQPTVTGLASIRSPKRREPYRGETLHRASLEPLEHAEIHDCQG